MSTVKVGKGVFHMIPGHVLKKKYSKPLYVFFLLLSTENTSTRSLVRSSLKDPRILCSTLIRAAMLLVLFPAVPTKTMVHAVALTVFLPFLVKDPFV